MLETKASLTDPPSLPSFLSQPFCTTQALIYLRNGYGTIWRSLFAPPEAEEGRKINAPDDVRVAKKIKGKNIFLATVTRAPTFSKRRIHIFCLPTWRQCSLRSADVFPVVASLPPKIIFGGRKVTTGDTSALRRLKTMRDPFNTWESPQRRKFMDQSRTRH